jgi:hypothetical protein
MKARHFTFTLAAFGFTAFPEGFTFRYTERLVVGLPDFRNSAAVIAVNAPLQIRKELAPTGIIIAAAISRESVKLSRLDNFRRFQPGSLHRASKLLDGINHCRARYLALSRGLLAAVICASRSQRLTFDSANLKEAPSFTRPGICPALDFL